MELLLAHGAAVNPGNRGGWTPLMTAAYYDDAADIKVLAARGADPNAVSAQNLTPLGIAVQYGKDAAAVALVEAGADTRRPIGEAAYTPLMLASANGSLRVAHALIEKGADLNPRKSRGLTPRHIPAAQG